MISILKATGICLLWLAAFNPLNDVFAQQKQITGRVTSSDNNQPAAGVTVTVKGARSGVTTDAQGNYRITVEANATTLVFSSASFVQYETAINNRSVIDVELVADVKAIDDVVVIGYQTVRRRDVLASVSSVGARELKDIPINSAAEALNGRLAGVTATTSEGSPDAAIRIRVRGGMSITGDNNPLYIIDGVPVENGLNTISPQDIQSIDVLKDAAATAIYGARGGNGVILITTKSGRSGRPVVTYNGFVGVRTLQKKLDVLSPYEYVIYQAERSRGNSTDSTSFVNNFGTTWDTLNVYKNAENIDWQEKVFGNTGITTTHNVGVSGGTKKLTYNFGYTYNNEKAIVINSQYKRHLINLKGEYRVTSKLKVGAGFRYTNQNVYGAGVSSDQGSSYNRLRNAVKYRPFKADSIGLEEPDPIADPNVGNGLNLVNPISLAHAEYRRRTLDAINFTANASYNITKNLVFRSTFGYDRNEIIDRQFSDSITPYSIIQGGKLPIAGLDTSNRYTITNSNVLTYTVNNYKGKHSFSAVLGHEIWEFTSESRSSLFRDYPLFTSSDEAFKNTNLGVPFVGYPKIGESKATLVSGFARLSYSFRDKYLFSANVRADGSSKFIEGKKWGYFPAGSFAWRITKEKFMENVSFINELKLRAGFGAVGNNRINDYLFLTTFNNDGRYYYGLNNQSVIGYYPTSLVNPNLKWEATINRNLGLDISLFNSRIDLSVDVYSNTSDDLLLNVPTASTYGYTSQQQNIGKTSNKGIEFQVNAAIARKKDFTWTANFNVSSNRNRVERLGVNQPFFFPAASWGVNGQPTDYIVRIGDPVGSMWGLVTDGFYTVDDFDWAPGANGYGIYTLKAGIPSYGTTLGIIQPGALKFKDLDGDKSITLENDRKIIGNPNPKLTGGLNQQFTYKNWDASLFVNFSIGNDIYNANKIELTNGFTPNSNLLSIMENRWRVVTPTGQTAQFINGSNQIIGLAPSELRALNANASIWQPARGTGAAAFIPHSWAIEDGSFLRLNNLTIGYTLPVKNLAGVRVSKLRFYLTGNNLAIITSYTGYDPEVNVRSNPTTPGLDYSAYPRSRSFIFGVNASF